MNTDCIISGGAKCLHYPAGGAGCGLTVLEGGGAEESPRRTLFGDLPSLDVPSCTYWDRLASSLPSPSQIGLLTTDSQMSSSILVQEARRRHQPCLDFPRRNPKAEIPCPEPGKSDGARSIPWSLCQYVIIVIAASWQHTLSKPAADVSAK
ncbi:unnamed protein product [Pleuronectes platessa]|uniref:Uncharacterized protein n=1 Tax=Pleuronectes platessa TaxID=8262 RepID=A0A9N7Z817_PLEPL|nr:unnamed protein product [Pleuronectes platessa]